MKRSILPILLFALVVGLAGGCSKGAAARQVNRAKELDERFRKVGLEFGGFVTAGDLKSAYAMTSSHHRTRKTYDEFAQEAAVPLAEGETIATVAYEVMAYEVVEALQSDFQKRCPETVESERQALVWFRVKTDADAELVGSALIVSERGQDRICDFSWEGEEKPERQVIEVN